MVPISNYNKNHNKQLFIVPILLFFLMAIGIVSDVNMAGKNHRNL